MHANANASTNAKTNASTNANTSANLSVLQWHRLSSHLDTPAY